MQQKKAIRDQERNEVYYFNAYVRQTSKEIAARKLKKLSSSTKTDYDFNCTCMQKGSLDQDSCLII
jgi:hypothetical protein